MHTFGITFFSYLNFYRIFAKIKINKMHNVVWVQEIRGFLSRIFEHIPSKLSEALGRVSLFLSFVGERRRKVVFMLVVLVTVASCLFLFNSILGQLVFRSSFSSRGTMKAFGVGVYWDNNCSVPVSSIDWGLVDPGLASNLTFYIRNEGNYAVTLFLGAENWNPENASDHFALKWDYVGQIIVPDETVRVTLSLLASADIEDITDFSFDVIISGTG